VRRVTVESPAFWTLADQAELELLVHELVDVAFVHRERCPTCSARHREYLETGCSEGPCVAISEAIESVIAWRDRRALLSRTIHLRAHQDLDEAPLRAAARTELRELEREREELVA